MTCRDAATIGKFVKKTFPAMLRTGAARYSRDITTYFQDLKNLYVLETEDTRVPTPSTSSPVQVSF